MHLSKEAKQERQDPETIGSVREERKGNLQDDAEVGLGGDVLGEELFKTPESQHSDYRKIEGEKE